MSKHSKHSHLHSQDKSSEAYFDNTHKVMLKLSSVSGVFLVGIMAAILFLVITVVEDFTDDKRMPKALSGQINLQAIDFKDALTLPLAGKWHFTQQILQPSEFDKLIRKAKVEDTTLDSISVPSSWQDNQINGKTLSNFGVATYRLDVKLKEKYENLYLFIPPIGTAHKLFVNDELISEDGLITDQASLSAPSMTIGIYPLNYVGEHFTITVQVANHNYEWAGIWSNLRLGTEVSLHEEQYRKVLQTTFIVAIFFTICVFNLIQFSLRPESSQPILIAFIAALLALRELEFSFVLELTNIYDFSFNTGIRINFITFFLTVMPITLYFYVRLREEMNRFIVYGICVTALICSAVALLTPPKIFSQLATAYQVFCLFVIVYIVYSVVLATIRKRENANVLLLGTLILFAFIANDILTNLRIIDSIVLVNFGLVAFVMCQNYLTYTYFINAGVQNKILNVSLSSKNKTLEELSENLEQQVAQRTQDLEDANLKLKQQVNEDPLTCLLNRRGLAPHFERARKNFEDMNLPFSILIIDFDHFKKLNDTQGHDVGDIVLESGGLLMKSIVKSPAVVGRWGGEEFLVLCASSTLEEARKIGEELRKEIHFCLTQEINFPVSITIGAAEIKQGESTDNCIKRADEALYQGKLNGRNRVELSTA
ncbi:diguanylate cyclase [Glaciecola sp. MH2013]|uniref:sensor domain-containing diguanylate cyclase n=1 Tax=Glaciecola sp. MH2013 TaxID=2785524 RepID=UPI00189EA8B8|nr:diguanylate cyclase [Glaciecola sp. MH2013]MBF7074370.1 diguanylate cyclase [Glaciecola sp. MH2013]